MRGNEKSRGEACIYQRPMDPQVYVLFSSIAAVHAVALRDALRFGLIASEVFMFSVSVWLSVPVSVPVSVPD